MKFPTPFTFNNEIHAKSLVSGLKYNDKIWVVSNAATPPHILKGIPGHSKITIEYIDSNTGKYAIDVFHIMPTDLLSRKSSISLFEKRLYKIESEKIRLSEADFRAALTPDAASSNPVCRYGLKVYFSRKSKSSDCYRFDDVRLTRMLRSIQKEQRKNEEYHEKYKDFVDDIWSKVIAFSKRHIVNISEHDSRKKMASKLVCSGESFLKKEYELNKFYFLQGCKILDEPSSLDYRIALKEEGNKEIADYYNRRKEQFKEWVSGAENNSYEPIYMMSRIDPSSFHTVGENCTSWVNRYVKHIGLHSSIPSSSPSVPWVFTLPGFRNKDIKVWRSLLIFCFIGVVVYKNSPLRVKKNTSEDISERTSGCFSQ